MASLTMMSSARQRLATAPARRLRRLGVRHVAPPTAPAAVRAGRALQARRQASSVACRAAAAPVEADETTMSPEELKSALLDSFWGTERGLTASADTRAEINELVVQLEASNDCDNVTEGSMSMLGGTWTLAYTSNSELIGLLGLGKLPFVKVGEIQQVVDPATLTVLNKLTISVPGSSTDLSTKASLTVESPKRVSLKFEQGTISTPDLVTDVEIPDSTYVMGQLVDLRQAKSLLEPVLNASKGATSLAKRVLEQIPDLKLPIRSPRAQTWLLTTYLDDNLRISRGDAGALFVLKKDSSAASVSPAAQSLNEGKSAQQTLKDVGSVLSRGMSEAQEDAKQQMDTVVAKGKERVSSMSDDVEDAVDDAADSVKSLADDAAEGVKSAADEASERTEAAADDVSRATRQAQTNRGTSKLGSTSIAAEGQGFPSKKNLNDVAAEGQGMPKVDPEA